jgi:hypothetical protein
MLDSTPNIIIISNADDLNMPTKDRLAEWIKKYDAIICYLQETHFNAL